MADKTLNITTGAAPWATAGSWTPSGVPANGDRVFINSGDSSLVITAASTQAAVLLAEIIFADSFLGQFDVDVAATIWRIGFPSGSTSANGGPSKVVSNNGTNAGTWLVYKSGTSADATSGLATVRITGTHASGNSIYTFAGANSVEIGQSLAAAAVETLSIQGGKVTVRQNATTKTITIADGELKHFGLSHASGSILLAGGTVTTYGDTEFPTLTVNSGGTLNANHRKSSAADSADVVTVNSGGVLNLQGDPRAFQVGTSLTVNPGGTLEHFGLSQITGINSITVPIGRFTTS